MTPACDHVWRYQHTVWWAGQYRPGSDAKDRHLGDRYYCEKCLESKIVNERIHGNTYEPKIEGVLPR